MRPESRLYQCCKSPCQVFWCEKGHHWGGRVGGIIRSAAPTLDTPLSYIVSSGQMRSCLQSFQLQTSSRNDKSSVLNTKQIKAGSGCVCTHTSIIITCFLCILASEVMSEMVLGANVSLGISHITCHSAAGASLLHAL